ncbi:hypothetical protein Tco_1242653 [Tanacetum coccineum]
MREGRLRWFGHVRRRPQSSPVRRVETLVVDGLRRRGRPKLRWEDRVKHDMKELLLSEDMTSDRKEWRAKISSGKSSSSGNLGSGRDTLTVGKISSSGNHITSSGNALAFYSQQSSPKLDTSSVCQVSRIK